MHVPYCRCDIKSKGEIHVIPPCMNLYYTNCKPLPPLQLSAYEYSLLLSCCWLFFFLIVLTESEVANLCYLDWKRLLISSQLWQRLFCSPKLAKKYNLLFCRLHAQTFLLVLGAQGSSSADALLKETINCCCEHNTGCVNLNPIHLKLLFRQYLSRLCSDTEREREKERYP